MFQGIDFYSDTITRPSAGMRKAMAEAEVGDEQKGEDPTTRQLEERISSLLGKSAALFFPSATMANQIAIRTHCHPGDELIADDTCHLFLAEAGGPAIHSGVMARSLSTKNGVFTGDQVRGIYRRAKGPHYPVSRLVSVENTTNMGGGIAWPLETLDGVIVAARELGLKAHLDGSRLFNAVVAKGCTPDRIASHFDTITVCLSKGLGCPVGAVLAFDKEKWTEIRRFKQLMGGALRQSGILAAAGLYALEHNVTRLQEDHENASRLGERIGSLRDCEVEQLGSKEETTNMVFFRWKSEKMSTESFLSKCEENGVRFSHVGGNRIRAVTHLDIAREEIDKAYQLIKKITG